MQLSEGLGSVPWAFFTRPGLVLPVVLEGPTVNDLNDRSTYASTMTGSCVRWRIGELSNRAPIFFNAFSRSEASVEQPLLTYHHGLDVRLGGPSASSHRSTADGITHPRLNLPATVVGGGDPG